ncbi:ATP-grasp domain-containing protein [Pinirhizobacter soli]|uniref:ATP-grasp domain-containing protein n=1 Tax=Pinirhizobacter soli TaxID=2786953 RepID=UPI00202A6BB4|nr:ATP-grasp domain-containing protein [Pinirhizobacter soli]
MKDGPTVLLLEHDAKELAQGRGIPVPEGRFVAIDRSGPIELVGSGPWVVKAQVPVGGRGKAGGVGFAATPADVADFVTGHAGDVIKGRSVSGFRVEERIDFIHEIYLALMVDASARAVRLMLATAGGVDIEEHADQVRYALAAPDALSLGAAACSLVDGEPAELHDILLEAFEALAGMFLALDATLLEVNPLFVTADGRWIAGDMKLIVDDNALPRQPAVEAVLRARADAYREPLFKLDHDFDYVCIDPRGQVGLLTTGAGLSMMLIDEMLQAERRPFNFCDVRTGQLRGSPERLVQVLRQFTLGRELAVVLVNVFAGITDLDEFARLLLEALDAVPALKVPVVARLIGNNFEAARARIEASGRPIEVERDLDRALQRAIERAGVVV